VGRKIAAAQKNPITDIQKRLPEDLSQLMAYRMQVKHSSYNTLTYFYSQFLLNVTINIINTLFCILLSQN